jgi:hypothetical protein
MKNGLNSSQQITKVVIWIQARDMQVVRVARFFRATGDHRTSRGLPLSARAAR